MSTLPKRQNAVKRQEEKHTAAGALLTDLIIPTIQLEAHFSRAGESIAATAGQSLARWLTLEMVAGQPATVSHVARKLRLTRQSVQRIADLLERDGLTEYADNPDHETSRLVRLTPRGRRILATIQAAQRAWANDIGGKIGEANLRRFGRMVDQLTQVLGDDSRLARRRR